MIPVLSLLTVIALSLIVTRVASVALVHTGLSRESARFQARSAFSGVGFTTSEAESVVGHPVRRRIVMTLMLIGNVGIVTAMSSLLLSALDVSAGGGRARVLVVGIGGLAGLWALATSRRVDRTLGRWISAALRRFTSLDARDFSALLHLSDDYGIVELHLGASDWLAGKTLGEARLAREGVVVLGVSCPGQHFIGAPRSDTPLRAGDTVVLYGRSERIADLDRREGGDAGDRRHAAARDDHAERSRREHARAGR